MPFRTPRILWLASLLLAMLSTFAGAAGRTLVYPLPPGVELPTDTVFKAEYPLDELRPGQWSEKQKQEIAYFRERMRKDPRIFLILKITSDPIGSEAETATWTERIAQGLAARLEDAGIPQDRMVIIPARRDQTLFDEPRWGAFEKRQRVNVIGLLGGDWLKRKVAPKAIAKPLPPEAPLVIQEPVEGKTDRANHLLKGKAPDDVKTVSVVVGRDVRTSDVIDGRFEVPISLKGGDNKISVTGLDAFGRALRATRSIFYVPPKPSITIAEPTPGMTVDTTLSPIITVRGKINSKTQMKTLFLNQNGIYRPIRFNPDGSFSQQAVLVTDEDLFQLEALDVGEQTGASEVRATRSRGIAERPLMAILHWDEDDVDLDLHVRDSRAHETSFDAPDVMESATAIPSGKLWVDNKNGFGPEIFTVEGLENETYTFTAEYYRGKKPCKAFLTVVLNAGSPSRRLVRMFGPIPLTPGTPPREIVEVAIPQGTLRERNRK
jgi:uncharacterized protein YfaP (DUF2135 family)